MLETFEEDKDIRRDGDLKERTSNNKEPELDCMDKENDEEENLLEKKHMVSKAITYCMNKFYIRCNVLFLMISLHYSNKILDY